MLPQLLDCMACSHGGVQGSSSLGGIYTCCAVPVVPPNWLVFPIILSTVSGVSSEHCKGSFHTEAVCRDTFTSHQRTEGGEAMPLRQKSTGGRKSGSVCNLPLVCLSKESASSLAGSFPGTYLLSVLRASQMHLRASGTLHVMVFQVPGSFHS